MSDGHGLTSPDRFRGGTYDDNLKLAFLSAFTAGAGYLGARYIKVAHCEPPEDDEPLDKLDEALKVAADKVQDMKNELAEAVDKKADELFAMAKEKYMTETLKEAFEFMQGIFGKVASFADCILHACECPMQFSSSFQTVSRSSAAGRKRTLTRL